MEQEQPKTLGIVAGDGIKTADQFGKEMLEKQMKGTAGTVYCSDESRLDALSKVAWELSKASGGLPAVLVVKAK